MFVLVMDLPTEKDRISFCELYEKTSMRFMIIAKSIVHNQDDAEEVVHDLYVDWMKNYEKYRDKSLDDMMALGTVMLRYKAINQKNEKKNIWKNHQNAIMNTSIIKK